MFIEKPQLRTQLILIKRATTVMLASKKNKKVNSVIRLIKWGWSETLQLSRTDDAWKSSEVDPCVYAQTHKTACFTNKSQQYLNSLQVQEITVWKKDENLHAKLNNAFYDVVTFLKTEEFSRFISVPDISFHPFIPLFISLSSLFCSSFKSP